MEIFKNLKYFQPFRWFLAIKIALLCGFIPNYPPITGGMYWVEDLTKPVPQREEILKIHSIMKRKGVSENSIWGLAETISTESKKFSIDPILVLAVIDVESRFLHQTISPYGARGLMQIRPFVGDHLAGQAELREDWEGAESLDDPILNVKLGIFYLGYLKKKFNNMELALTAYNWGPTRVQSRLEEDEPISLDYADRVLSKHEEFRQRFRSRRTG